MLREVAVSIKRRLEQIGLVDAAVNTGQWLWWGLNLVLGAFMSGFAGYLDTRSWEPIDYIAISLLISLALSAVWALLAVGRANWSTAKKVGVNTQTSQVSDPTPPQPPFIVRFKERGQNVVGSIRDDESLDHTLLLIEVRNASGRHLNGIEVSMTGESSLLSSRAGVLRKKIEKHHLTNRRGATSLNPGQSEDYILLSVHGEDSASCWGDHKIASKSAYSKFHYNSQHIIEVSVTSQDTPPFTKRMVVVTTSDKDEILPVFPEPMNWIWNG